MKGCSPWEHDLAKKKKNPSSSTSQPSKVNGFWVDMFVLNNNSCIMLYA